MFSMKEKQHLAAVVEKALLELGHPEMPKDKPRFKLHVDGVESWSWADIEPNWTFADRAPGVNPWNEQVRSPAQKPEPYKCEGCSRIPSECPRWVKTPNGQGGFYTACCPDCKCPEPKPEGGAR
jgi:hypothetical protein